MNELATELAEIYLESCDDIQACDSGNGEIQNDLIEMGVDPRMDIDEMAADVESYCAENASKYGKVFNRNQTMTNLDNTLEIKG